MKRPGYNLQSKALVSLTDERRAEMKTYRILGLLAEAYRYA